MTPTRILLEHFRTAKGWSQSELARRSGVPQSTISRIETGETGAIQLENLERLARALGLNHPAMLIHYEPDPGSENRSGRK